MKTHGISVDYISCRRIGDIYISYPDVRMDDISMNYPAQFGSILQQNILHISFTADR